MEALACTKYRAYTLEEYGDAGTLPADVAHGGFDPSFAMENGNRVLPVDVLEDFAKDWNYRRTVSLLFMSRSVIPCRLTGPLCSDRRSQRRLREKLMASFSLLHEGQTHVAGQRL